jgi:hypothetical protein
MVPGFSVRFGANCTKGAPVLGVRPFSSLHFQVSQLCQNVRGGANE